MYTRERKVNKLTIKSVAINKVSDKSLNKLAKEIVLINNKRGGNIEESRSISA